MKTQKKVIFNRKGKPINIDEVLDNVTEKEFFREFKCGGFFTRRYKEEKRIETITLNNGCVIHYKPNPFNGNDAFKCFAGKHINVKNIQPFNFDEKQEYVYLLTNLREECYFIKVEKNESGLKIPSFKSCSEVFLTAEDCEKYLKEAFENGVDTSGIYFSKLDLNRGDVRGYFKDISTGKLYTVDKSIDLPKGEYILFSDIYFKNTLVMFDGKYEYEYFPLRLLVEYSEIDKYLIATEENKGTVFNDSNLIYCDDRCGVERPMFNSLSKDEILTYGDVSTITEDEVEKSHVFKIAEGIYGCVNKLYLSHNGDKLKPFTEYLPK